MFRSVGQRTSYAPCQREGERFLPRPVSLSLRPPHVQRELTLGTRSARNSRKKGATFKMELAYLIKKGFVAGLTTDDMADELTEAANDLASRERNPTPDMQDPVDFLIASHRP
jgi:hypothetical protein